MRPKILIILLAFMLAIPPLSFAVSDRGFVLSVIHNGYPVKEIDRRVAIPFDTEYKVRLKNTYDRRATAKILIDGVPVSKLGNIVIPANGSVDIERFLDSSLTEGKKFKFVRLDDPAVDDPTKEENGIIQVEFRLEKEQELISIIPPIKEYKFLLNFSDTSAVLSSQTVNTSSVQCSSTLPGATVEGSESNQRFARIDLEEEDEIFTLQIRLVGINQFSKLEVTP